MIIILLFLQLIPCHNVFSFNAPTLLYSLSLSLSLSLLSDITLTDPADIPKDLANCKAVVLDVSAPQNIIETFIDEFAIGSCPLILVASQTGTNDRKKDLAVRVIEDSGPTLITGRLGDIYAVAQAIEEKSEWFVCMCV